MDIIILAIVVVILGVAIAYIIKAKKSGAKCIGCPTSGSCCDHGNKNHTGCSCGCGSDTDSEQQDSQDE